MTDEKKNDEMGTVLKSSTEKPNFWKPIKKGDRLVGKLISITSSQYGDILRVSTKKGIVHVPITTYLKDIDFESNLGSVFSFVFDKVVGRGCKLFTVTVF